MSISKHRNISLAVSAVILIADRLVKYLVAENFELYYTTPIIKGLLEFCYLHNDGAAMGMLSGNRFFLIALPIVMIIAIFVVEFSGKITSPLTAGKRPQRALQKVDFPIPFLSTIPMMSPSLAERERSLRISRFFRCTEI